MYQQQSHPSSPALEAWRISLSSLEDVDVNDGSHLFKLLDDGDGNLTQSE